MQTRMQSRAVDLGLKNYIGLFCFGIKIVYLQGNPEEPLPTTACRPYIKNIAFEYEYQSLQYGGKPTRCVLF